MGIFLKLLSVISMAVMLISGCGDSAKTAGNPLSLSVDGKTEYVIVKPDNASAIDNYAVNELYGNMQQITGAEFKIISADKISPEQKCIFVGISKPVIKNLGADPISNLKEQEHVIKTAGENLYLYGKGIHGNMYAVFEFLETNLGWRWFSHFEHPVIPHKPTLTLNPVDIKKGFSFPFRKVGVRNNIDFPYIHGANLGISARIRKLERRHKQGQYKDFDPDKVAMYKSIMPTIGGGHNFFRYLPPSPDTNHIFECIKKRDYFKTNPEYFSMWDNGKRVPNKQFCLSNQGLRKELTKNILTYIESEGMSGKPVIVVVMAMDCPGKFCYCPECKKLEEKYKSPGGPMYDYLIELCGILAEKQPKAMVISPAYRISQTEIPPVLPDGGKLPKNLIIDFAPIEDAYFADWKNHQDERTQRTYSNIKDWGKVCENLFCWQYPNPWGTGIYMPVGNVQRLINNIKMIYKANGKCVFMDHNGSYQRANFSELQYYLFLKLLKDVNADTDAIINEFTDSFYGAAAPMMRKYMKELEQCRIDMKEFPADITYRSANCDMKTFPYLTEDNIYKWQKYFDEMEKLVSSAEGRIKLNVNIVRRELDFATLWKWYKLKKKYPDYFKDYTVYENRIKDTNNAKPLPDMKDGVHNRTEWEKKKDMNIGRKASPLAPNVLEGFITLIKCGGEEKPLPDQFKGIDESRIKTFVPKYSTRRRGKAIVKDSAAGFGYGVPVAIPDLPFTFGFYQNDAKKHGAKATINKEDIVAGAYKLYKLGTIDITPKCMIWFSSKSWETNISSLGEQFYAPGEDNHWEAYVELKFDGPTYTGGIDEKLMSVKYRSDLGDYRHGKNDNKDLVLVGRIIMVKQKAK